MHFLWSLVLATAAVASAQNFAFNGRPGLKYNNKRPRGFAYTNATAVSNSSTTTTSSTSLAPSSLPGSSTGPWTSSSAALFLNNTTDTPTCTGFVTYLGTVPPTVYITVTEGFDVTVTASNVSVTDTPTLITPLPACQATIIPGAVPGASNAPFIPANATGDPPDPPSPTRTGGFVPQIFTASLPQIATAGPDETATPQPFAPAATQATPIYTSAAYTSTVVVTKKTPVTVVAPSTTSPPVNFQSVAPASAPPPSLPPPPPQPSPSTTQRLSTTPKPGGNNAPAGGNVATDSSSEGAPQASSTGGGVDTNGGSNQGSSGGNSNTGGSSTPGANSNSGNTGEGSNSNGNTAGSGGGGDTNPIAKTNIVATSSPSTSNQAGAGHGTPVATTSTKLGLGNIIASILNSPFATPAPTASGAATPVPLTTTIDNVRVVVSSSNVIIGSQAVAIPTVAPTTVRANGATFTTITFITAVGDLTFTVGPTVAVLSDTTYRIGPNAPATTLTMDGTKVSIGSDGVGLPSTTIAPATVVTSPFVVYTTEGLTISVDQSEAVVAGATYEIGSDASQVTTTISGETISFGPGGVGLDSTTIAPTAPVSETTITLGSIRSTATTTSASHTAPSTTQSVTQTDSGSSALRLSLTEFGSWPLMAVILGLLVF
ncbi:hypothetical protein LTR10_022797 [Elasticomyces elasticus]|uniref:Uncharacterized protein n=1 Tax=Exophiala sideris TaxID=1016849 RepID=A0ABR0JHG2_9EURO|nr:hypothetical protein LTR10_022797 [Elasticomyces elasticus]KAK5033601.1 hypothetical protein LTS07_003906 [Exophiala sideris]KAK5041904.1 hypothetical protein LTR13_001709 [Exophiala sideris]KAK5064145.1 hypothetical protein LTR69_003914 [Exophiala sideris]KAK5185172.1 hypothetical protein LTR44_002160 [Eurotiomycetes sp. CCFEE 6388]